MASKFAQIATLENLSESGQLGATEDALKAAETATEVAEGNAEVLEGAAELDNVDTGIEDAFDAHDQVDELLDAAEETMKDGGMSESEAKLLEVTHESIMANLGMGHRNTNLSRNPVMTLESYGSSQTRSSATLATIESLKDTGKSIVTSLIAALKAAWNVVTNFVVGLLRNRALLEKHLTNLQGKVKAIGADLKPRNESFKSGAAALSVDGKADAGTAKLILESAVDLVAASMTIASSVKVISKPDEAAAAIKVAVGRLTKHSSGTFGNLTFGRSIKVTEGEEGTVSLSVEEGKKAESIKAPSKKEMEDLLTGAKMVVGDLKQVDKIKNILKDVYEKAVAALSEFKDTVRSKVGGKESEGAKKAGEAAAIKKGARLAKGMMTKAGGTFPTAAFQAVKAIADYVTAGVNNFKVEKKEEPAKA